MIELVLSLLLSAPLPERMPKQPIIEVGQVWRTPDSTWRRPTPEQLRTDHFPFGSPGSSEWSGRFEK